MKTNVPVELTDDQRNRLAILLDGGKQSKKLATRRDVINLVGACVAAALDLDPNNRPKAPTIEQHVEQIGVDVIHDINAGAWSFIGE